MAESITLNPLTDCPKFGVRFFDPAGSAPSESLENFLDFQNVAPEVMAKGIHYEEVTSCRSLIFWEGVYWLHKASHVISAAELHAQKGILTWSWSSGFQGGLFAARSIINLLGVAIPGFNGQGSILVDIWPEKDIIKTKRNRLIEQKPDMLFIGVSHKIDNRHVWMLFQRLLRIAKVKVWPEQYLDPLKKLAPNDFSWHRNNIHYHISEWPCKDLFNFILDDSFGIVPQNVADSLYFDKSSRDFPFILGNVILRLALVLFESLADLTNKLNREKRLFENFLNNPKRHPTFVRELP